MALTFAKLKLRTLRNGFRGRPAKILMFVLGLLGALFYGALAFLLFLAAMTAGHDGLALAPAYGGTLLALAWLLMPLVWFGVDETLDPARFALLPIPKLVLLRGLLVGALIGVPAAATLLATSGLAVGAAIEGGPAAGAVGAVGVLLGLVLCVLMSRAVTSGFARALRARRTRDLAAVVLAVLAASLGPIQYAINSGAQSVGMDRLESIARVLGWTPFGAPYVVGQDAVAGDWAAVAGRLALTAAVIVLLAWWWSTSLESAMVGSAGDGGGSGTGPARAGSPTARFFRRSRAPRTAYGAMLVRELRYWLRDARRRASLITFAVVGIFLPVMLNVGPAAGDKQLPMAVQLLTMVGVGTLASVGIANQFGYDGSAYAAQVVAGIPGRLELRARAMAYSWLVLPVLLSVVALTVVLRGHPAELPAVLGVPLAAYGTGLACCLHLSVWGAYALPETQNPFAINTGTGVAKSLLAMAAMIAGPVLAAPVFLLAAFGGPVGSALALPVGLAYGLGAAWLGALTAGDALDRRQPELLAMVTPKR
ncbi:ABC transporter permease [Catellatospora sp. KI3]|uniref:ABC transporter permease n=1 Tax=Catellatospora sp. KI3 TaxID=3041620 RepID=UPI002482F178|nr:ABC transporter permease [Catellatospora sp. KI3]MDI1464236.1 ABC transporter permease [Catellatospora sp. KI3]